MRRTTLRTPSEPQDKRRRVPRSRVRLLAKGKLAGTEILATIHDMSTEGILIEPDQPMAIGDSFEIELVGGQSVDTVVKWTTGKFAGCQFQESISKAAVSAARLLSPHPPATQPSDGGDQPSFGTRLRDARRSSGITQQMLAKDMRISCAAVSNWEKGKTQPRAENLAILEQYFPQLRADSSHEAEDEPELQISLPRISILKADIANLLELDVSQIRLRLEIDI